MDKTILILGGGIGGIVAARELRRHLGAHHRIVLVDKDAVRSFPPSYLWVVVGWRKPAAIQKPLSLLKMHGIEFLQEKVEVISTGESLVETDRSRLRYDYLVVALGAELAPETIPGWTAAAHSFYTLEQAERLRASLLGFSGGTIAIVISGMPYKCPPAPYESSLILDAFYSRRLPDGLKITVFTPESAPVTVAGSGVGAKVADLLSQRGIGLFPSHRIISVDPAARKLSFENGSSYPFDLLVGVPPHRCPGVVRAAGLTGESGWIPVDRHTLRTPRTNVFAIGDVTAISLQNGTLLPKAGIFASGQAEIVAYNLAREIHGHGVPKEFSGVGHCYLETGYGRAGYIQGDFYALHGPEVVFHEPSVTYHWKKVLYEKYWLWRWF